MSPQLSAITGMNLYFKKEFTLPTGSFKERGARNSLKLLSPEQCSKGVIAASAGNHALALSYHGKLLDIPVTVVMPRTAPLMKYTQCEMYGATVHLHGDNLAEVNIIVILSW
jgi:threonine dehydratase